MQTLAKQISSYLCRDYTTMRISSNNNNNTKAVLCRRGLCFLRFLYLHTHGPRQTKTSKTALWADYGRLRAPPALVRRLVLLSVLVSDCLAANLQLMRRSKQQQQQQQPQQRSRAPLRLMVTHRGNHKRYKQSHKHRNSLIRTLKHQQRTTTTTSI